jgi:hypothetical protein
VDWTPRDEPLGPAPSPVTYPATYAPTPPQQPKRRTGLWLALAGGGLAVIVLLAVAFTVGMTHGRGGPSPGAATFFVNGTLDIASDCDSWGYDDIRDGAEVQVTDASGRILAVGNLTGSGCHYSFTIPNVPAGLSLYGIQVGHRGAVHYSETELRAGPALSLGS